MRHRPPGHYARLGVRLLRWRLAAEGSTAGIPARKDEPGSAAVIDATVVVATTANAKMTTLQSPIGPTSLCAPTQPPADFDPS